MVDERARAGGALVKEKSRGACKAALILSALWVSCLPAVAVGADALEQVFEVEPDVRVDIEIVSGKIELKAIDASEVRVRAKGGIEVDGSRRRVSLRAPSMGWLPWAHGTGVELEVEVPRQSRITARIMNGGIKAEGMEGELVLHAANGAIEVEGAPREAHLETMNAAIKFEGDHSEVVARTLNGEIELEGVSGEVEASTVSGRIRVEGDEIERAELRTMSGEIELDSSLAKGARVEAKSYSGRVRLRLPENTSARFEVQSFSGGVHSEFVSPISDDESGHGPWHHGPSQRRSFVVGDGDARISIESFSGGVEIEESGRKQ
jgi:DUF4097 and DUF4098 domain-containing protein YvlB